MNEHQLVEAGDFLKRTEDLPNSVWIVEEVDEKFFITAQYILRVDEDGDEFAERLISRVYINDDRVKTLEEQGFTKEEKSLE